MGGPYYVTHLWAVLRVMCGRSVLWFLEELGEELRSSGRVGRRRGIRTDVRCHATDDSSSESSHDIDEKLSGLRSTLFRIFDLLLGARQHLLFAAGRRVVNLRSAARDFSNQIVVCETLLICHKFVQLLNANVVDEFHLLCEPLYCITVLLLTLL